MDTSSALRAVLNDFRENGTPEMAQNGYKSKFIEGKEMEERCLPAVTKILRRIPGIIPESISYHCSKDSDLDLFIDRDLGIDCTFKRKTYKTDTYTLQLKCGTHENYEKFGADRQSIVLGDVKQFQTRTDTPIKSTNYLLSAYEIEQTGEFVSYCLVNMDMFRMKCSLANKAWKPSNVAWSKDPYVKNEFLYRERRSDGGEFVWSPFSVFHFFKLFVYDVDNNPIVKMPGL